MKHREIVAKLRLVNLVLLQRKEDTMTYDEELEVKKEGILARSTSEIADAVVKRRGA